MDNDSDLIALLAERVLNNTLALIAIIVSGGAYFVFRFAPSRKHKTGEYVKAKPTDLMDVIQQLSKSQATMSELLANHPDLFTRHDRDATDPD